MDAPRLLQNVDRDRLQLTRVDRKLNWPLIGLSEGSVLAGIGFEQHRQYLFLTFGVCGHRNQIIAAITTHFDWLPIQHRRPQE